MEDAETPLYANAHVHKSYLLDPPEEPQPEPEPELELELEPEPEPTLTRSSASHHRSQTPPRDRREPPPLHRLHATIAAVRAAQTFSRASPPLPEP